MCIAKKLIGKPVLVRTYSSGVHYGTLTDVDAKADEGYDVELTNVRRIYQWTGAFSLNELAAKGVSKEGSKFSMPIPVNYMTATEIILMTPEGFDNLNSVKTYEPE